jgi:hypothetical protein
MTSPAPYLLAAKKAGMPSIIGEDRLTVGVRLGQCMAKHRYAELPRSVGVLPEADWYLRSAKISLRIGGRQKVFVM